MKSNTLATTDRKVSEYCAVARAEIARLTKMIETKEALITSESEVTNWADVNECADLARSLKDIFPSK